MSDAQTDDKVDLVFRGELVPGADLAQVKQNLSQLFKMDAARIEVLFSGKPVVLKRGVDLDAAGRYRVAMKKAGARVETIASRPAKTAKPQPQQPEPQQAEAQKGEARDQKLPEQAGEEPSRVASSGAFSLAPVGGYILAPNEKRQQAPVSIDTSSIELRPAGEDLLDEQERKRPAPLQVGIQEFDLAPVGADVLRPDERRPQVEADIDLSKLAVAPPGERLQEPAPAPPPAPDVSNISLADEKP